MTVQNLRLVAELTAQEEAEMLAIEATIRSIHQLDTATEEDARRVAKTIRSIRDQAERNIKALLATDVGKLNPEEQREHLVQLEMFSRTLAAANKMPPSRPI